MDRESRGLFRAHEAQVLPTVLEGPEPEALPGARSGHPGAEQDQGKEASQRETREFWERGAGSGQPPSTPQQRGGSQGREDRAVLFHHDAYAQQQPACEKAGGRAVFPCPGKYCEARQGEKEHEVFRVRVDSLGSAAQREYCVGSRGGDRGFGSEESPGQHEDQED